MAFSIKRAYGNLSPSQKTVAKIGTVYAVGAVATTAFIIAKNRDDSKLSIVEAVAIGLLWPVALPAAAAFILDPRPMFTKERS